MQVKERTLDNLENGFGYYCTLAWYSKREYTPDDYEPRNGGHDKGERYPGWRLQLKVNSFADEIRSRLEGRAPGAKTSIAIEEFRKDVIEHARRKAAELGSLAIADRAGMDCVALLEFMQEVCKAMATPRQRDNAGRGWKHKDYNLLFSAVKLTLHSRTPRYQTGFLSAQYLSLNDEGVPVWVSFPRVMRVSLATPGGRSVVVDGKALTEWLALQYMPPRPALERTPRYYTFSYRCAPMTPGMIPASEPDWSAPEYDPATAPKLGKPAQQSHRGNKYRQPAPKPTVITAPVELAIEDWMHQLSVRQGRDIAHLKFIRVEDFYGIGY